MAEQTQIDAGLDPVRAMRSRWLLCLVIAGLGALAGAGLSTLHTTQTTAEARLAVGSQSLDAYQVGSYAEASSRLAANYARFVQDSPSGTPDMEAALAGETGSITAISASPIPESNVVRIEVTATRPEVAVLAAQVVADNLLDQANEESGPSSEALLAKHETLAAKVVKRRARVERRRSALPRPGSADRQSALAELSKAEAFLTNLELKLNVTALAYQQSQLAADEVETRLEQIQPATVTGDDQRRTLELYTISGLLAGLAVAAVVVTMLPGRRRRESPAAEDDAGGGGASTAPAPASSTNHSRS